jgi:hypothetical protein
MRHGTAAPLPELRACQFCEGQVLFQMLRKPRVGDVAANIAAEFSTGIDDPNAHGRASPPDHHVL